MGHPVQVDSPGATSRATSHSLPLAKSASAQPNDSGCSTAAQRPIRSNQAYSISHIVHWPTRDASRVLRTPTRQRRAPDRGCMPPSQHGRSPPTTRQWDCITQSLEARGAFVERNLGGAIGAQEAEISSPHLQIIVSESERLTALIENVLDFAKVERGKAAYEFAPGQVEEVVARAFEVFRYRAEREGMEVGLRIPGSIPRIARGSSSASCAGGPRARRGCAAAASASRWCSTSPRATAGRSR